ncbi:hypothetical protein ACP4OV_022170 [Aristida adscensionis]
MASTPTRSHRYAQLLSSHPYHFAISSAPSFGTRDDDGDGDHGTGGAFAVAASSAVTGYGAGAGAGEPASPRLLDLLREASARFLVSAAPPAASLAEAAQAGAAAAAAGSGGGGAALRGAVPVETYSRDPKGEFLESMTEMVAACDAEGMPEPQYREFMAALLSCFLERNDQAVHRHVLAAFADVAASRSPATKKKKKRPLRRLMNMNPLRFGRIRA